MPVARDDQRPLGVVYTPRAVTAPMVRLVVDPLARSASSTEILALRVCDPAIGAGAFVLEIVDALAAHLVSAWRREGLPGAPADARELVATTCVRGVDIDPVAVATARERIAATYTGDPHALSHQLRVGNALALDWHADDADVFARGGFDVVIGNPPYIRQEQLATKTALRGFASYDGVADLYVYFLELGHRLLRSGGTYCWIVPNKWLTSSYGRRLRTLLAREGSVDGIVDLARVPLFVGADAFPCIVWGTAGEPRTTPIRAARVLEVTEVTESAIERAIEGVVRGAEVGHVRERWAAEPWHIDAPSERGLLERLEREHPRLDEVVSARPSRGVVTGLNRAFVVDRETRDRLVAADPASARLLRPFVKGRDLARWRPEDSGRWILLVDRGTSIDDYPALRDHLGAMRAALEPRPPGHVGAWRGRKPGAYAWYELQDPVGPLVKAAAPRLLYQDIQTGPACALDRGELVPDTTVWMLPTDDRVLLAILNSSVYGWYAQRRFPPALNGAVRPKYEYMRKLPIARPDAATTVAIEQLVEQRLALADQGSDAPTTALDRTLDDAISDLYQLSAADRSLIDAAH